MQRTRVNLSSIARAGKLPVMGTVIMHCAFTANVTHHLNDKGITRFYQLYSTHGLGRDAIKQIDAFIAHHQLPPRTMRLSAPLQNLLTRDYPPMPQAKPWQVALALALDEYNKAFDRLMAARRAYVAVRREPIHIITGDMVREIVIATAHQMQVEKAVRELTEAIQAVREKLAHMRKIVANVRPEITLEQGIMQIGGIVHME